MADGKSRRNVGGYNMKRAEFYAALEDYKKELTRQDEKHSTGSIGKLMDVIVRDYLLVKGIKTVNDVRCRKTTKVDVKTRALGKIEIKTGSGAVAYGAGFTKEDCIAENVCNNADFIVWAPFSMFLTENNFPRMFWMFTRQEFINALETIGKNGLQSSLKVSKQGAQLNIQTITPKMEERLWNVLENVPTLEEFTSKR